LPCAFPPDSCPEADLTIDASAPISCDPKEYGRRHSEISSIPIENKGARFGPANNDTGLADTARDVYHATNLLEQTKAAIPQLTIRLEQGENALCVLLGGPPQPLGRLLAKSWGRITAPPRTVAVRIPADLLRRRPDIRTAELAAMAQSAQIGIAEAELLPAVSIIGTFGGSASTANGHNLGQVFTSKGMAYAGPAFQWNILNYGQITNNARLQDVKLQQLLVDYQDSVLNAQQEVDNGISAFLHRLLEAVYLRRGADAAAGALKVGLEQYEQGTTDFTTVLTAEQNLLQVESNLAAALANVSLGLTAIYRAETIRFVDILRPDPALRRQAQQLGNANP
jgi:outer membrane protein TolC